LEGEVENRKLLDMPLRRADILLEGVR